MTATTRHHSDVDLVLLELIRLVTTETWTARQAAAKLRQRVPDDQVLRATRAHVRRALRDGSSTVAERAAATLDAALAASAG